MTGSIAVALSALDKKFGKSQRKLIQNTALIR
jgi:hypothetical protein